MSDKKNQAPPSGGDNPFLPFAKPALSEAAIEEVVACLRSGWITTGPRVQKFEEMLSKYHASRRALCVSSATAGLQLALMALDLKEGDEIITTPLTFVATLNTIVQAGATPVLVDIDDTLNIDVSKIEAAITKKTRAIMPVHFAGLPCDMEAIYGLANKHKLRVVEDCAHAIGAEFGGKKIGSFGDIAVMSFHPNKNITTGEGGAVITDDKEVIQAIERWRFHGIDRNAFNRFSKEGKQGYDVVLPGYKYNMMDMQAALGIHQLPELDGFIQKRTERVAEYIEALADWPELQLPAAPSYPYKHAWHLFTPRLKTMDRNTFIEAMKAENIGIGLHYEAVHGFSYYRERYGWKPGDFPNALKAGNSIVSLPLFPTMTDNEQARVLKALEKVLKGANQPLMANPYISVVIPVYNEELTLPILFDRLIPVMDTYGKPYEIIFVNDGSRDRSQEVLRALHTKRPDVIRAVQFMRNYGQHPAIMAGFERVKGEVVVTLDCDLQNPPEDIPKLLDLIEKGHDVVGGYRGNRQDLAWRKAVSKFSNIVRKYITNIDMKDHGCMLRAYRRHIIDQIVESGEATPFITALSQYLAGNPTEIEVGHEERAAGVSNYNFYKLIRYNFDLMTGFSLVPLQLFTFVGMILSAASFVLVVYMVLRRIFLGPEAEGVFTLFAILFLLVSVAITGLGIIGEYIGRIHMEVRHRPRYVIKEIIETV